MIVNQEIEPVIQYNTALEETELITGHSYQP